MKYLTEREIDQFMRNAANMLDSIEHGPDPVFTKEYQERKAALLQHHRRKKGRRHKRLALIAAAVILSVLLAACTKPIREFFIQVFEQFTSYFFTGQEYQIADLSIKYGYLPKGYILAEELQQGTVYIATYQREGGEADVLKIKIDSSSNKRSNINNEDVAGQEYIINGYLCIVVKHEEEPETFLYYDSEYAAVRVSGILPDDELIRVIEEMSITVKE